MGSLVRAEAAQNVRRAAHPGLVLSSGCSRRQTKTESMKINLKPVYANMKRDRRMRKCSGLYVK
jgi:hypothetical protein